MKTKRTKRTTTLAAAWARRDKLYAEGDLVWIDAWIAKHGKDSVVEWTNPKGDR